MSHNENVPSVGLRVDCFPGGNSFREALFYRGVVGFSEGFGNSWGMSIIVRENGIVCYLFVMNLICVQ